MKWQMVKPHNTHGERRLRIGGEGLPAKRGNLAHQSRLPHKPCESRMKLMLWQQSGLSRHMAMRIRAEVVFTFAALAPELAVGPCPCWQRSTPEQQRTLAPGGPNTAVD